MSDGSSAAKKLASVIMNLPNPDQIKTFLTSTLPTLQLLLRNILSLPAEDKYRCLKTSSNLKLRDVVVNTPGVEAFVGEIGFSKDVAGNYVLPLMASLKVIQDALSELTHVEMDVAIHLRSLSQQHVDMQLDRAKEEYIREARGKALMEEAERLGPYGDASALASIPEDQWSSAERLLQRILKPIVLDATNETLRRIKTTAILSAGGPCALNFLASIGFHPNGDNAVEMKCVKSHVT
eukprot:PhF_6_TR32135/c0_g2_i1/m.47583